jgi:hypothetical protein
MGWIYVVQFGVKNLISRAGQDFNKEELSGAPDDERHSARNMLSI